MKVNRELEVFLNPKSVAVIGATERPGSWGSFIMQRSAVQGVWREDLSDQPACEAGFMASLLSRT